MVPFPPRGLAPDPKYNIPTPRVSTIPNKYQAVVAFTEKLTGSTLRDRDYKILIALVEHAGKCDG